MTQQAHMLGLVLMLIIYLLLSPLVARWIESPRLIFGALILLFVPVFGASHWLADVLDTSLRGDFEEVTDEDRRPRRHDPE